jgi:D-alanyl-D-alanine-carboxypeptidase/D-alanyl-D-alanine-endopeptidase
MFPQAYMTSKVLRDLSQNILNRHVITACSKLLMIGRGEFFYYYEVSNMNGQRCTLTLLAIAVNCCVGLPIASSQNLTEEWVEKAAAPLIENQIADGLSVGYIEGEHYGIVHLGSSSRARKNADNLTVYEIGSVSKVFTGLMLADAVVRGEIDLNAAVDIANPAGIRLPSRDGRSIKWIDLSTHRSGLPRLPGNLPLTDSTNPYRDYDSKKAAAFLNQYELPRQPGDAQEYSNFGVSVLGYLVARNACFTANNGFANRCNFFY